MSVAACPPNAPPVHGVVVFVAADFKAAYPEFATVADAMLTRNFGFAQIILSNSCRSIIPDAVTRETFLYLLTAHITALFNGVNGLPPAGIVGRVNTATQGTVSVGADFPANPDEAWFIQTQWGAMFWQLTVPFRTAHYIPPQNMYGVGPWAGRRGF